MARIRPFRALRYDVPDLEAVVAPPYDVISEEERAGYLARSPYNVVHLTLPASEEQAARDLAAWQEEGVLVRDPEPSYWWLAQDYVGPFGDALTQEVADAQLLIADGHHRYETALAFGESPWLLAVIVPTDQEGLTIFPTHRLARSVNGIAGTPIDPPGDELPGVVLYRDGRYELVDGDGLDPEIVDALKPEGVTYTPQRHDAIAAVDRGEAEAAFLLRPTRIEDVWEVAGRGDVMPQKSTFFYAKLTSGLLLHPLD